MTCPSNPPTMPTLFEICPRLSRPNPFLMNRPEKSLVEILDEVLAMIDGDDPFADDTNDRGAAEFMLLPGDKGNDPRQSPTRQ